eukprot:374135-Pelagomonas_calceolata.AAC.1
MLLAAPSLRLHIGPGTSSLKVHIVKPSMHARSARLHAPHLHSRCRRPKPGSRTSAGQRTGAGPGATCAAGAAGCASAAGGAGAAAGGAGAAAGTAAASSQTVGLHCRPGGGCRLPAPACCNIRAGETVLLE